MTQNAEKATAEGSYSPLAVAHALDWCAKWWWGASLLFKLLGFLTGVSIVLPFSAKPIPFIVAVFTLFAELSWYRSEAIKSRGQWLRRKLDLQDSLGWEMSGAEFSDLIIRCPASVKSRARSDGSNEPYFASKEQPGPARAIHNVMESAWWSKHLSERMSQICLGVLIVGAIGAIAMLIVAVQAVDDRDTRSSIARVVTALLMFLLSIGVIKLGLSYSGFAKTAGRIEEAANSLDQSGHADLTGAIKIMCEYHIARAVGPIIPTWIWRRRRDELNATWERYRAKKL
jgi:hypothetical protein